jgi:hypothetical protein
VTAPSSRIGSLGHSSELARRAPDQGRDGRVGRRGGSWRGLPAAVQQAVALNHYLSTGGIPGPLTALSGLQRGDGCGPVHGHADHQVLCGGWRACGAAAQVDTLEVANQDLEAQLAELQVLNDRVRTLEAELEATNEQVEELESSLEAAESEAEEVAAAAASSRSANSSPSSRPASAPAAAPAPSACDRLGFPGQDEDYCAQLIREVEACQREVDNDLNWVAIDGGTLPCVSG